MTLHDNLKLLRLQFPSLTIERCDLHGHNRPGVMFRTRDDFLGLPATWPANALIDNARAYFFTLTENLRLTPRGPLPPHQTPTTPEPVTA